MLKKICWYAVLAPSYSTAEGSSSDVSTLIATTAAYKQLGDLSLHQQLLTTFTNPEIIRWGLFEAQYGPEITAEVRWELVLSCSLANLTIPAFLSVSAPVHLHASMLCRWIYHGAQGAHPRGLSPQDQFKRLTCGGSRAHQGPQVVHTSLRRIQSTVQCVALQQRYNAAPWHGHAQKGTHSIHAHIPQLLCCTCSPMCLLVSMAPSAWQT